MALPFKIGIIPVTAFQQNCSIVWDDTSKHATIIDPGGDAPRIIDAIDRLGLKPRRIVLTHGHLDHVGAAAELRTHYSRPGALVPVEGPDKRDDFLMQDVDERSQSMGLTGMHNVTPDRWLQEGESVDIAGYPFKVLHTPGHTPGHLCFVHPTFRFAFVGDVLFKNSIGRTDFLYGDHDQLIRSIREKLLPLGDDVSFICGHGPGSTIGDERRENPFL